MTDQTAILLCSDLDRTIIPNGAQAESSDARKRLTTLCQRPEVTLVYVTGRHRALVEEAINDYSLPSPDYMITDVGSKIYQIHNGEWQELQPWLSQIDLDWQGKSRSQLAELLLDVEELRLQESSKQNRHKLSYYAPLHADEQGVLQQVRQRLEQQQIAASLVWSIDEPNEVALLDILPKGATKQHAVEFLYQSLNYPLHQVMFAGDSGNDLAVLGSEIPSVLVANASDEIKHTAQQLAQQQGNSDALYIANGSRLNMNGNYSAGVLEGVWHYFEALRPIIEEGS